MGKFKFKVEEMLADRWSQEDLDAAVAVSKHIALNLSLGWSLDRTLSLSIWDDYHDRFEPDHEAWKAFKKTDYTGRPAHDIEFSEFVNQNVDYSNIFRRVADAGMTFEAEVGMFRKGDRILVRAADAYVHRSGKEFPVHASTLLVVKVDDSTKTVETRKGHKYRTVSVTISRGEPQPEHTKQIEQDDVPVAPKYQMRPADITAHYREVCSYLSRHDIDAEARARICGLAEQTLKQYGALDGTKAHRKIALDTLNKLREAAVEAYWTAAEDPYRTTMKIQNGDNYIVPSWIALRDDGSMCERHPHPLRVHERADIYGGHVIDTTGAPSSAIFDEAAELRSRWRKATYKCNWAATDGYLTVEQFLCGIADCCPYSLWRIGSEFGLWAIQPTAAMVERLEDAIRELEMPEEEVAA